MKKKVKVVFAILIKFVKNDSLQCIIQVFTSTVNLSPLSYSPSQCTSHHSFIFIAFYEPGIINQLAHHCRSTHQRYQRSSRRSLCRSWCPHHRRSAHLRHHRLFRLYLYHSVLPRRCLPAHLHYRCSTPTHLYRVFHLQYHSTII